MPTASPSRFLHPTPYLVDNDYQCQFIILIISRALSNVFSRRFPARGLHHPLRRTSANPFRCNRVAKREIRLSGDATMSVRPRDTEKPCLEGSIIRSVRPDRSDEFQRFLWVPNTVFASSLRSSPTLTVTLSQGNFMASSAILVVMFRHEAEAASRRSCGLKYLTLPPFSSVVSAKIPAVPLNNSVRSFSFPFVATTTGSPP